MGWNLKRLGAVVGVGKGDDELECPPLVSSTAGKSVIPDSGKQSQKYVE